MIECEGLTRAFGATRAVEGLSITVPDGAIVALLGPNGAGKTTTVRMLAGLIGITAGRAWIDDVDVNAEPARARAAAGLLMGEAGLYDKMTLRGYLSFFAEAYGLDRRAAISRAEDLAAQLGLADRLGAKLQTFSKGMRQRVALGRALVSDPRALFLDEPTSGLDVEAAMEFRRRIEGFRDERRSIILCTHILEEAEQLADEVIVIQQGRIVGQGTTTELKRGTGRRRVRVELDRAARRFVKVLRGLPVGDLTAADHAIVFTTEDPSSANPAVVRALVGAGAGVVSVAEVARTLQDAYVDIVRGADG